MWTDTGKFYTICHRFASPICFIVVVRCCLKSGRVFVKGLYSEKTGKLYDAWVVLDDNGEFIRYRVEFERRSV